MLAWITTTLATLAASLTGTAQEYPLDAHLASSVADTHMSAVREFGERGGPRRPRERRVTALDEQRAVPPLFDMLAACEAAAPRPGVGEIARTSR
ncbi:MAG: hypothetical protein IPM29_24820 [Planctomycetes bacterium]|nr:hypothetical protein [Planctomycetota bacterium]